MTLQIYNTLTRKKETFKPKNHDKVKVYSCWPSPYDFSHIGNLKTYVMEDMVIRTLRFLGYWVVSTMNITDIEDKIIRRSLQLGVPLLDLTRKYTSIFFQDLEKLWVEKSDNVKPISELIPEMVQIINGLLKRWYAYHADDRSIYYRIEKFKNYGKLANLNFEGMKSSVRINNDEYEKESVGDFVLWKAYDEERDWGNFWTWEFKIPQKNNVETRFIASELKTVETRFIASSNTSNNAPTKPIQIKWRPGWHIECSACNMKFFGPEIDLHMGWVDNIFPHHQNEIAQTEAYTGKKFCRCWLHGAHILVDGKKMSKSLGNFYTLRDIEEHFKDTPKSLLYRAIRLAFIAGKYRENIDFSFTKIEANFTTLKKLDETLKRLNEYYKKQDCHSCEGRNLSNDKKSALNTTRKEFSQKLQNLIAHFIESLEDDFAIPEALVDVYETITLANTELDSKRLSSSEAYAIIELLRTYNQVLWIMDFSLLDEIEIPTNIQEKLNQRNEAKQAKNFTLADALRDELLDLWWKIIDNREGTRLEKI